MNALRFRLWWAACFCTALGLADAGATGHRSGAEPKHLRAHSPGDVDVSVKPRTLTLETVVESALESFPSLIAAAKRKDMAAGEKLAAEGGFDTNLKLLSRSSVAGIYENEMVDIGFEQPTPYWGATFFGGYRLGSGNYPVYEGKSQTADSGEFRAGVTVPLWRNRTIDRRRASLAQAELSELIAHHDYDAQLLELQRVASQRYWDWVLAGRRLAASQDLLRIAESRDTALKARVASGDLPAIEAIDNQRAILERQERVVAAERLLEQAAIQLSLYLRSPDGQPQLPQPGDLPARFPEPSLPQRLELQAVVDEALSRRPEVKRLEQQRKTAEIDQNLARNMRQPGVDLSLSGAQDLGINPETKYYQINRSEMYLGVSIDLPVQQRVASGKMASADANLERIQADYQLLGDRITAEVRDALSAIKAALKRLEIAQRHRETALLMEDGERTRYELGDSNLMFVNQRELASGDAAVLVADAYSSFHKSLADYHFAVGDLQMIETKPAGKGRLR
jgi:cobalt-zinc-cadmium efflux system outer membrane protein